MPLQFIFGPSGSGKSYHLYHQIIDESRIHQEQNYIVLVPEQFTMQTQKDLVNMHPCHGIMNIDVLSFVRLSYRVFEETGGGTLPVLDDEGKNLILRKIAGDYEGELKVLGGNMKKLGYVSEVKSVISEFAQYDITEEELERVMETAGEEYLKELKGKSGELSKDALYDETVKMQDKLKEIYNEGTSAMTDATLESTDDDTDTYEKYLKKLETKYSDISRELTQPYKDRF